MRPLHILAAGLSLSAATLLPALAGISDLKGPDGSARGTVTVSAAPKGVVLKIEAKGLTPGWHGIHFHEKGSCADPKLTSAGSHVHNAKPVVHGLLNPNANDSGDLPNIFADSTGSATAEIYSTLVSFKGGSAMPSLLDADGSAVVIHANADDHTSQPIGGAGDRVACAVIR
jgi:Cu-Zn family superoxide dismutase